ncbi:MAG TPA: sulfate adenylyltransferase subunit CysN [Methylophaga aminisulfidivorans]|uniref:Sulfate adenylyltransferase subunit 1 n=1 Tax=Methylophaga aminisulfidivorans TaxID=230105 RepID=A0A7C1W328_9GAMM|nr:sulfate adenylyltransferase subunit CysN [Methylophaga aminisulfidivorans]HEC72916.1 sulfate adenylyltransferase subunit CysN [Methylophaga aminisulfidivorans]
MADKETIYEADKLIATDIDAYLKLHENKEMLRFLTCGNVDDGKSTLIGRLLYDSKMIYEDQLESVTKDSVKSGTTGEAVDLALLVDGLQAEREQGITIDVAYRYFSTTKRKFIIADTPGHEQYTRNMATGASNCQLAVILIDARYGVQTQTRRHSYIANLLGIKHIIVAVNKMDIKDYSEQVFNDIRKDYTEFARELEMQDVHFVPLSALLGDNVVNKSENMPWYTGETLMELLENVEISSDANLQDVRFPVQYVNRPNLDFRGYCGTLASGILKPGDDITVLPSGKESKVKSLVTYDADLDEAIPGEAITVTLQDEIDISRGDMIVHRENQPHIGSHFKATVVWMTEQPLVAGKQYSFKVGVNDSKGTMTAVEHQIDVNTLAKNSANQLALNEIGVCDFSLTKPIVFDAYKRNHTTGSFIIIDRLTNVTIGAGMITEAISEAQAQIDSDAHFSDFEVELNALIRKHFPHWDAKDLSELLK